MSIAFFTSFFGYFANSFTPLQFINRFNAVDWVMIPEQKSKMKREEENYFCPNIYFQLVLGAINQRKMISFNFFSLLLRVNELLRVGRSDIATRAEDSTSARERESQKYAAMFAQCTFSTRSIISCWAIRKTEECFILILRRSSTNTFNGAKQGSEWNNNGKENNEKPDEKRTRKNRKTFAQRQRWVRGSNAEHMQHAMCC